MPIFYDAKLYYRLFTLFSMYQDGFLPEEGGINAQPALLIEYFEIMKQVKNLLDREDLEKGADQQGDEPEGVSLLRR